MTTTHSSAVEAADLKQLDQKFEDYFTQENGYVSSGDPMMWNVKNSANSWARWGFKVARAELASQQEVAAPVETYAKFDVDVLMVKVTGRDQADDGLSDLQQLVADLGGKTVRDLMDEIYELKAAASRVPVASVAVGEPAQRDEQADVLYPLPPTDPLDMPLPCDVTVGHGTMRKGVALRTLVLRMKALYELATGNNADEVAGRTIEQRRELFEKSPFNLSNYEVGGRFKPTLTPDAQRLSD
jgi:hypothetical protein